MAIACRQARQVALLLPCEWEVSGPKASDRGRTAYCPCRPHLLSDQLILSHLPLSCPSVSVCLSHRVYALLFVRFVPLHSSKESQYLTSQIFTSRLSVEAPLLSSFFLFFSFPQWSAQCKHKLNCVMWTKANRHSPEQQWRWMKRRWHTKRRQTWRIEM